MASFKHPNPKVYNQLLSSHNPMRLIKFLLSFSLLCVLFSSLPLLLHCLKPFLMQYFSYTTDKRYMFILCNGLLVSIAITSGLVNNASSSSTHQSIEIEYAVYSEKRRQLEFNASSEIAAPIVEGNVMEIESPQEEEKSLVTLEAENVVLDTQEDEEEVNSVMIITNEEEEEEEEKEGAESDEFNKKCEEFIKKMKAEFYFDNQNQKALVAVN